MITAAVSGIAVAFLTPKVAGDLERALLGVTGALLGALAIALVFLVIHCQRSPYRQRDEQFAEAQSLREAEVKRLALRPDINVTSVVRNRRAILEVYNSGPSAYFVARGRVNRGPSESELYTMYWDAIKTERCQIDQGETASILVAERQQATFGLFYLQFFRLGTSGEQTFPAPTVENIGGQVIIDDKCSVEITITSEPPMKAPFRGEHFIVRSTGLSDIDSITFEAGPNPRIPTLDTAGPRQPATS